MNYKVIKNNLTIPPSFYPLAIINKTIGIDDVASLIHDKVSNIPVDIARDAINEMVFVIKDELQNGNWVNFTKFLSLRTKMFGSMESSTDYHYNIKVIVIIAKEFQIKTKKKVVLKKGTSDELIPVIFNVKDTESGMNNFLQYGYGVEIYGENLKLDMSASDEGVLIRYPSGTEVLQENIIMNNQKKLISGVASDPAYGGGPGGQNNVEHLVTVKNRNGSMVAKSAVYSQPVRAINKINADNPNIFLTNNQTSAPAVIIEYPNNDETGILLCMKKADGIIMQAANITTGDKGIGKKINGNTEFVLDGLPSEVKISVIDYEKLLNNVKSYGGYMFDVVLLSKIPNFSYEVPPTGQIISYRPWDNGTYQKPLLFTKLDANGNALPDSAPAWEYVKQNATGLIYKVSGNTGDWSTANAEAAAYSGLSRTWRVPTIKELAYLGDYSIPSVIGPMIPSLGGQASTWASTEWVSDNNWAWIYQHQGGGTTSGTAKTSLTQNIVYVSGDITEPLLTDNGDGTVSDQNNKLMWTKDLQNGGVRHNWNTAIDLASASIVGGYNDWRLPNAKELLSLVDFLDNTRAFPSIFPVGGYYVLWSSTTVTTDTSCAWVIPNTFYTGRLMDIFEKADSRVTLTQTFYMHSLAVRDIS